MAQLSGLRLRGNICYDRPTQETDMNQFSKPAASDANDALTPDARRRAAADELVALLRQTSAEAQARGLSMTQEEIDEEMALYKAERRG